MTLNNSLYSLKRSAIRVYSKMAKETPGCIALTLGEPDFNTPETITQAAIDSLISGDTHYIQNNGEPTLREEICRFEENNHGLKYSPDEVIATIGATEGLFVSLFGVLNPDDEVIVPTPAFGLYESIITMCKGKYVPVNTSHDDFQLTKNALDKAITKKTKAIIINSPNNPTGCILNSQSLENVYEAVKGKDIFVICDDVYRDLIYTDSYHSFAEFEDIRKQIIVIQSFSKPYAMTGWRIGYILADISVKQHLELVHQFDVVSTVSFMQKAGISALNTDISPMLEVYKKRREYVLKRLQEIGLDFTEPMGGFYVFPKIDKFSMNSDEFCKRLIKEGGLALTPGACFGDDSCVRLTYCYDDKTIQEGLNRLEKFIKLL